MIDKSGANRAGLEYLNALFLIGAYFLFLGIEIVDVKYLNNIVEQSHRPIKQNMFQALGWKSKEGTKAPMSGQETWTMIKLGQTGDPSMPT